MMPHPEHMHPASASGVPQFRTRLINVPQHFTREQGMFYRWGPELLCLADEPVMVLQCRAEVLEQHEVLETAQLSSLVLRVVILPSVFRRSVFRRSQAALATVANLVQVVPKTTCTQQLQGP